MCILNLLSKKFGLLVDLIASKRRHLIEHPFRFVVAVKLDKSFFSGNITYSVQFY